jgi:glyoxylase-like metal-dependent hydrolase (beta-lactamase superfamily II)
MKPRKYPAVLAVALMILAVVVLPSAAEQEEDPFAKVEIETTKLTETLYMLKGRGGNLGLCVGKDGVFLVDDQYAPLTEKILAAIAEITDQPVQFVFNTHWHGDHTGGNENFGKTGSLLVSHTNVRRRMSTEQFMDFFDETEPAAPDAALPVVTFTDSLTFHYNDEVITAFHVPHAHTDGDGVVHFPGANVVHSGDIIWYTLYPYIDYSAGGTIDGMIEGTRLILGLCDGDTRVITGHGPLIQKPEVENYLAMLTGIRDAVAAEKSKGKSLEETQAAAPAAAWDEDWGKLWLTSDQFVAMVYKSLK